MKILVLYYSQSGQLKEILDAMLKPLADKHDTTIRYEALTPVPAYPFPWDLQAFLDVFPESFQEIACELAPLKVDPEEDFDLVILAYSVWYLAPAIPITSFLQSPVAKKVLKDRPVVTVIGCRNMWLMAQEKVKQHVLKAGGRLEGNIVLGDRSMNLVGVATIVYWMLTGKKQRPFKLLPKPGISDADIQNAKRFGPLLKDPATLNQDNLNALGAVHVVPSYILFEKRIQKMFVLWSAFIRQKGGPADPRRHTRVRLFFYYLLAAIFLIAPLATIATLLVRLLKGDKLRAAAAYFSQNSLKR